jgi:hypothetical protein
VISEVQNLDSSSFGPSETFISSQHIGQGTILIIHPSLCLGVVPSVLNPAEHIPLSGMHSVGQRNTQNHNNQCTQDINTHSI